MRVENADGPRELLDIDRARSSVERVGHWYEDIEAQQAELVLIPETNRTRLALQRENISFPIVDRTGLFRVLGISSKLLTEVEDDEELVTRVIVHCKNKRHGHTVRFAGTHTGVTSVQEPHGAWFPPLEVFDILADELKGQVEEVVTTSKSTTVRFVGEYSKEPAKKVGDSVHAGMVMSVDGDLRVAAYCYQLSCANGAMMKFEKLALADTMDVLRSEVRSLVQVQHNAARELTDDLVGLDDHPFEGNREQILVRLAEVSGLPGRIVAKAIRRLPELPENATLFDAVSLLTNIASRLRRPERVQIRCGSVIRHLKNHHPRCTHCGTVVQE